jgi:hypothetical protein
MTCKKVQMSDYTWPLTEVHALGVECSMEEDTHSMAGSILAGDGAHHSTDGDQT